MDIRQAIVNNFAGSTVDTLEENIVHAMKEREEKILPGLGVLFEIFWESVGEKEKEQMLKVLKEYFSRH